VSAPRGRAGREGRVLDDEVKYILNELCRRINRSLKDSREVAASVRRLEELGYEIGLHLEATVLLSQEQPPARRRRGRRAAQALKLGPEDAEYLRQLRISLQTRRSRGSSSPSEDSGKP
jgi:hypothetical protein